MATVRDLRVIPDALLNDDDLIRIVNSTTLEEFAVRRGDLFGAGKTTVTATEQAGGVVALNVGGGKAVPSTVALSPLQVNALALRHPLTAVGDYVGTGSALTIAIGWVPDFFVVKSASAATEAIWQGPHVDGWLGKSNAFVAVAGLGSAAEGIVFNSDGSVTIGTDGRINTVSGSYEWFAFKDNGCGQMLFCNHSGNDQPSTTIRYAEGAALKSALWKRDSTQLAVVGYRGKAARRVDGSAATSATINADGSVTIGQGADLNQWTGNLGEGVSFVGVVDGAASVFATTYIGTGVSKPVLTPFDDIDAILIFPRAVTTLGGAFWTSRLSAGTALATDAVSASTVGAQAITSVNQGRITLGTSGRCNSLGVEYVMWAFRRNRQSAVLLPAVNARPLRTTKHLVLSGASYVNCGTSAQLEINGAITLEWWGCHFFSTPTSYPTNAGNDDNSTLQAPLIWRSNGADGVSGSVSYGLMVMPAQSTGVANPLGVAVTDIFNMPKNASAYDLDDNQPWCTGTPIKPRSLQHVLVTHDGLGVWRVYLNGKLTKERRRDMAQASPARPNVASGAGHTFVINGRKRTTTPEMTSYTQAFFGARVYARELSAAEAYENYEALFADSSSGVAADFREEWLAANGSGASLPATVSAGNSGVIVGNAVFEGE